MAAFKFDAILCTWFRHISTYGYKFNRHFCAQTDVDELSIASESLVSCLQVVTIFCVRVIENSHIWLYDITGVYLCTGRYGRIFDSQRELGVARLAGPPATPQGQADHARVWPFSEF